MELSSLCCFDCVNKKLQNQCRNVAKNDEENYEVQKASNTNVYFHEIFFAGLGMTLEGSDYNLVLILWLLVIPNFLALEDRA